MPNPIAKNSAKKIKSNGNIILFPFMIVFLFFGTGSFAAPQNISQKEKPSNGKRFQFPQDHLFHKGYRVEWCYFVGILETDEGRELGYELSFFRAYAGPKVAVYPVHFAISDMKKSTHRKAQTFERELGDVAGQNKGTLWSGDYRMEVIGPAGFRISAFPRTDTGFGLELELKSKLENIIYHGNSGKSLKSRFNPQFYSYYYSIPRMTTTGTLYLDGKEFNIKSGTSWMDHEWSSLQGTEASFDLSSKDLSWDWICIQMEDGSDIMAFNFMNKSSMEPETFGTFRSANGKTRYFEKENELFFQPEKGTWKSSDTGISYKLRWKLISDQFKLNISPKFEDQEFDARSTTGLAYWEGGVQVEGEINGNVVKGTGYLELKPSR